MKKIAKIAVKQSGRTFTAPIGSSHQDIRQSNSLTGRATRGFQASDGGFLTRKEAYEIALKSKQIKSQDELTDRGILHSHHLINPKDK